MAAAAERRAEVVKALLALSVPAYQLAVHILDSSAAAEDAVQQAYLNAIETAPSRLPPDKARAWFLRVVANAAKTIRRSEARRSRRESAMNDRNAASAAVSARGEAAENRELIDRLRTALRDLDEEHRLPVALHYEQGLSHGEIAAVLDVPRRTVTQRITDGLERLRGALSRSGYAAAPAAAISALAHTAPVAPAGLSAKLQALIASEAGAGAAAGAGGPAGPAGTLSAKGGLIVKIGLGIAAAGLAVGGAFWAVGGATQEAVQPKAPGAGEEHPATTAPAAKKFDVPVWSPDARWERSSKAPYLGFTGYTDLDGPRAEAMWRMLWRLGGDFRLGAGICDGSRSEVIAFDHPTERVHTVAGGASGYLDGPFSRMRMGIRGYCSRIMEASSADGRYYFFTDFQNQGRIRCMDFEKQEVKTLLAGKTGGIAVDSKNRLLVVDRSQKDWRLIYATPDGAVENGPVLEPGQKSWTPYLALDEVHGRLYAGGYIVAPYNWYVWYWDLKDGKFHGVLPYTADVKLRRKLNELGPFAGTYIYGEVAVGFGPDDPDKRFLYIGCCDTRFLFRLDLANQVLGGFDAYEGRFKETGFPRIVGVYTTYSRPPLNWRADGSFVSGKSQKFWLYQRTK